MKTETIIKKIEKTLTECELHQKRIEHALKKLQNIMPLDVEHYEELDDEEIEALDQFLFRFAKFQDAVGQRLFLDILLLQEEPVKALSFLDKLNRLEQLGVIPDKTQWLMLRDIRNKVAHEYEDDPIIMCEALNHIYNAYPQLISIFLCVKDYLELRTKKTVA